MNRPNLFIVGAMKSGSTTLHDYLAEHPEIFMSAEKEPGFFVPEMWAGRQDEEYERLFALAGGKRYVGESSTHYTKLPTYPDVAEKIHRFNPEARILYIVRHPIKRTISHYLHNRRDLCRHAENRPLMKAVTQDATYTAYSHYAMQIQPYFELFGRDQVLVLLFEEMVAAPQQTLGQVFQWLGVEPDVSIAGNKQSNATPAIAPAVRGLGLLNQVRYSSLWHRFSPYVPKQLKKIGNLLAEKKEKVSLSPEEVKAVTAQLRPLYQEYVKEFEVLIGRNCTIWRL